MKNFHAKPLLFLDMLSHPNPPINLQPYRAVVLAAYGRVYKFAPPRLRQQASANNRIIKSSMLAPPRGGVLPDE